ncbi:MAG TPA: acetate--CoA ligase family protein [Stellaceae bacterium]|nr:acetate--CoA ligase family protein [Stellaceae bacterium]
MTSQTAPRLGLREILHPRSVAVLGASEDKGKFGGRILHYLRRHGFAGTILPINPRRQELLGLRCYPDIGAAPGPIDVAILAVPPAAIADSIAACAAAGVGGCIVITTGFAEAGSEGEALQQRIVALARGAGMRLFGPNCMGLINLHHDLCLTSSLVLEVERLHKGGIGLVSQSGALMVSMFNRAHDAGIGFSACVSLGNQSDVTIEDVFEYFIDDPKTRIICMYVEGLKEPRRFLALAERARRAEKPVLALKTGRTEAGIRAARSHTASLAGAYAVFAAACRDHGILLTDDPDGMIGAAALLDRWGPPLGDGIGILSSSGGGAGIGVDRVEESGMRLARLEAATRQSLVELLLPPQADNPVDLGGRRAGDSVEIAGEIMRRFAADPDIALILLVLTTVPFYAATARALAEAALASGKPLVIAVTPGSAADPPRAALRELGCPFFDRIDDAIRALAIMTAATRRPAVPAALRRPAELPELPPLPAGALSETEAKALLGRYGVPLAAEFVAPDAEAAVAAARKIGFPVALKAMARGLVHKSDIGAVRLDLADEAAVDAAFHAIQTAVAAQPEAQFEGALVAAMVRGEGELIIGAKFDPQFGPVVLLGLGGVLVELVNDIRLALAPIGPDRALALLRELRLWPLLDGYRGRAKLDVEAAAAAISRVSWLAADLGPRLVELDVNPLILRRAGEGAVAVDARATLADG